jgi:hypothetical protein
VDVTGELARSAAKSWLEECRSNHDACRSAASNFSPTRLIDVASQEGRYVKFHITDKNTTTEYKYVALSYCWGGDPPFEMTEKDLCRRTQSGDYRVHLHELPATLQDAVEVTRGLGFQYLWVDALCIIQDSDMDKSKEIQRMGKIYSHATLTIMASTAGSVRDGFLRTERKMPPTTTLQIRLLDEVVGNLCFAEAESFDANSRLPLNSRGWAFQESILSPRHLVYSEHELIWRCRTENYKTITKSIIDYSFGRFDLGRMSDKELASLGPEDRNQFWANVVEDYTSRQLSEPNDRLPAITGVAKVLSEIWKDTCSFGLMKSWFVNQLSWGVQNNETGRRKPRSNRAPTWSWVSLDCEIVPWTPRFTPDAEIEAEGLTEESSEVTITGHLIPLSQGTNPFVDNSGTFLCTKLDNCVFWTMEEKQMAKFMLLLGSETVAGQSLCIMSLYLGDLGKNRYRRFGLSTMMTPVEGFKRVGKKTTIVLV